MDMKKLIDKYFKDKNKKKVIMNLIVFALLGVLLILIGDITTNLNGKKTKSGKNIVEVDTSSEAMAISSSYEEKIRNELVDTLAAMAGVGRVKVMIYFDGGSESLLATNNNDVNKKVDEKDTQGGTRTTNEISKNQTVVMINEGGGSKPVIVKQVNPSIGGVMVVAEGAQNVEIKEKIHNAVKTVLGIPYHKVSVMPMKNN